ncbi:MAG: hypothetical protein KDD67_13780 [Ignavibacteriae bacterium]|nr:hypothetical protein [Ignavibacteriota bacterium]MCB9216143.1 hypothetical protein [Ignavibacteria bacterium]
MGCACKDIVFGKVGRSLRSVWGEGGDPSSTSIPMPTSALTGGEVLSPLLTFDCATNHKGESGRVVSAVVIETADAEDPSLNLDLDLVLVDTVFVPGTVGSALTLPAVTTILGVIPIRSWTQLDTENAIATVEASVDFRAVEGSTEIYGVIVNRDAGTFDTGAVLRVKLNIVRD